MNLMGVLLFAVSVVSVLVINTQDAAVQSSESPSRRVFKKKANLNLISSNIKNLLKNSKSIDSMILTNGNSFACISGGLPCDVIKRDVSSLNFANEQEYINTKKTGFDFNGNACELSTGNCDLSLDIKWVPDCGSPCSDPSIIMEVKFIPLKDQITKVSNFNFNVNLCDDNGFCDLSPSPPPAPPGSTLASNTPPLTPTGRWVRYNTGGCHEGAGGTCEWRERWVED